MSTLREVALAASVSMSTVSRVLNGQSIVVSKATRDRITEAARSLGYYPNAQARSLRQRRTNTVGVLVPDLANPFFAEVLEGIRGAAAQQGYMVLLADTVEDLKREHAYVRLLREQRVDGVIITTAGNATDDHALLSDLQSGEFPCALICRPIFGAEDRFIGVDDLAGARLAVNHLVELGHRRIAHLSGPLFAGTSLQRLQGYRAALRDHGIPFDERLVVETNFSEESGYEAMRRVLTATRPTAVFAANDMAALGAVRACDEAGLAVPGDCSVMGFNDIGLASRVRPKLTTIHMPLADMGAAAFALLAKQIAGEPAQGPVVFQPTLVVRESTGPVGGDE